jgi:hypothetical protein
LFFLLESHFKYSSRTCKKLWTTLPTCTVMFNVDRAHSKMNDFSACGWLLRYTLIGWRCPRFLLQTCSQGAEIWSLLYAMCIIHHLHIDRVISEMDSTIVVIFFLFYYHLLSETSLRRGSYNLLYVTAQTPTTLGGPGTTTSWSFPSPSLVEFLPSVGIEPWR